MTELLLERTHAMSPPLHAIPIRHSDERLTALKSTDRMRVEPIWYNQHDDEGARYRTYLAEHAAYREVYVRQTVKDHLAHAAQALDDRYVLIVRAGHRPYEVQQAVLEAAAEQYMQHHPRASISQALAHARLYVSDPAVKTPPHCCGAAVDVDLFDTLAGRAVDFGSTMNQNDETSHLYSSAITDTQHGNRMVLLHAMLDAGFASYPTEWWHYSYGDQLWAWMYDQPAALYDMIEI